LHYPFVGDASGLLFDRDSPTVNTLKTIEWSHKKTKAASIEMNRELLHVNPKNGIENFYNKTRQ